MVESGSMRIYSSHLALRFYRRDGWTEELVREYIQGELVYRDDGELGYFIPDVSAIVLSQKVLSDGHIVSRWAKDAELHLTDLEYLESFN